MVHGTSHYTSVSFVRIRTNVIGFVDDVPDVVAAALVDGDSNTISACSGSILTDSISNIGRVTLETLLLTASVGETVVASP